MKYIETKTGIVEFTATTNMIIRGTIIGGSAGGVGENNKSYYINGIQYQTYGVCNIFLNKGDTFKSLVNVKLYCYETKCEIDYENGVDISSLSSPYQMTEDIRPYIVIGKTATVGTITIGGSYLLHYVYHTTVPLNVYALLDYNSAVALSAGATWKDVIVYPLK